MEAVDVNIDVSVFVVGYVVGIFTYTDVVKTTTEATEISLFLIIFIYHILLFCFLPTPAIAKASRRMRKDFK